MEFYTYLEDEGLKAKWKKASEDLAALVADDNKLMASNYGKGMDKSCIPFCNALNLVPGVATNSSCEGHGDGNFFIQFYCRSMPSLHFLCDVFTTGLYDKESGLDVSDWNIEFCNWHSIELRCFENVEFSAESSSLGHEPHSEIRLDFTKEMAHVIARKAKQYCDDWDAYLVHKRSLSELPETPTPMVPTES